MDFVGSLFGCQKGLCRQWRRATNRLGRLPVLTWPRMATAAAVVLLTAMLIAQLVVGSPTATAAEVTVWTVPVDAMVIDPFRPPRSRFGAGNRGLEFGTGGGEAVVAVADGRVTFVGQVGGQRFVVVTHPDGLRSTYAYLRQTLVTRGQRVARGERIALASVGFHLTARLGDTYIDPALLFAGVEIVLALVVSDLPMTRAAPGRQGPGLGRGANDQLAAVGDSFRDLQVSSQIVAAAEAVEAWYREDCTDPATPIPLAGAGRVLIQVAGLGSTDGDGSIGGLDASSVGYLNNDVVGFSYAGGCTPVPYGHAEPSALTEAIGSNPYRSEDTYQDISQSAARLADLVEQISAARPGQPIDVAAHSLGGVVTRRALEILDQRGSVPVSVVITIASPHQGTDLATAAVAAGADSAIAEVIDGATPVRDADSVFQVAEAGQNHLDPPEPPPQGVAVVAVAGATDLIVPADAAIWTGAENVIVPTTPLDGPHVHSELPANPLVARNLNLAIAGAAPGCVGLAALLGSVASGRAVSSAEDLLSVVLGLGSFVL